MNHTDDQRRAKAKVVVLMMVNAGRKWICSIDVCMRVHMRQVGSMAMNVKMNAASNQRPDYFATQAENHYANTKLQ